MITQLSCYGMLFGLRPLDFFVCRTLCFAFFRLYALLFLTVWACLLLREYMYVCVCACAVSLSRLCVRVLCLFLVLFLFLSLCLSAGRGQLDEVSGAGAELVAAATALNAEVARETNKAFGEKQDLAVQLLTEVTNHG